MIIRPKLVKFFRFQLEKWTIIRNNILFAWGSVMHALAILCMHNHNCRAGKHRPSFDCIVKILLFLDLRTILSDMMCLHINSVSQNEHHCNYTIIITQLQMYDYLRQKKI